MDNSLVFTGSIIRVAQMRLHYRRKKETVVNFSEGYSPERKQEYAEPVTISGAVQLPVFPSSTAYYLSCRIVCPEDMPVFLTAVFAAPCRLWLNRELVAIHHLFLDDYIIVDLKKGENIFEFETEENRIHTVALGLYDARAESRPGFSSRLYQSYIFVNKAFSFATNGEVFFNGGLKRLLIWPKDRWHIDPASRLSIRVVNQEGRVFQTLTGGFFEEIVIDTAQFPPELFPGPDFYQVEMKLRDTAG